MAPTNSGSTVQPDGPRRKLHNSVLYGGSIGHRSRVGEIHPPPPRWGASNPDHRPNPIPGGVRRREASTLAASPSPLRHPAAPNRASSPGTPGSVGVVKVLQLELLALRKSLQELELGYQGALQAYEEMGDPEGALHDPGVQQMQRRTIETEFAVREAHQKLLKAQEESALQQPIVHQRRKSTTARRERSPSPPAPAPMGMGMGHKNPPAPRRTSSGNYRSPPRAVRSLSPPIGRRSRSFSDASPPPPSRTIERIRDFRSVNGHKFIYNREGSSPAPYEDSRLFSKVPKQERRENFKYYATKRIDAHQIPPWRPERLPDIDYGHEGVPSYLSKARRTPGIKTVGVWMTGLRKYDDWTAQPPPRPYRSPSAGARSASPADSGSSFHFSAAAGGSRPPSPFESEPGQAPLPDEEQ